MLVRPGPSRLPGQKSMTRPWRGSDRRNALRRPRAAPPSNASGPRRKEAPSAGSSRLCGPTSCVGPTDSRPHNLRSRGPDQGHHRAKAGSQRWLRPAIVGFVWTFRFEDRFASTRPRLYEHRLLRFEGTVAGKKGRKGRRVGKSLWVDKTCRMSELSGNGRRRHRSP